MIRKILNAKSPSLREKSKEVAKIDKKVLALVRDMKDTLASQKDPEGVGLAAPQIGKNIRLFIMDHEGVSRVVINPKILSSSKEKIKPKKSERDLLEGCLSLPHYYGPLHRNPKIKISYQDETGEKLIETFTGFAAQIVQHEIDHLNGIIFIDRIIEQKSPLYEIRGDDWKEVELT